MNTNNIFTGSSGKRINGSKSPSVRPLHFYQGQRLICLVLLATLLFGCSSQASSVPARKIQIPSSASQADIAQAESEMWQSLRDPIRAGLGPEVEPLFNQADTMRTQLLTQAVQDFELSGQSSKGHRQVQFEALASVIVFLTMAAPQYASHAEGVESKELPFEVGGANGKMKITLSRSGSTIAADVEMNIDITGSNGNVFHENAKGQLEIQVCPDVEGRVPAKLSLTMSSNGSGANKSIGMQFVINGKMDVFVNDEAEVDGYDIDIISGFGAQSQDGSQVSNQYAEVQTNMTFHNFYGPGDPKVSGKGSQPIRGSSTADAKTYQAAYKLGTNMSMLMAIFLGNEAKKIWQNGYCVEILIEGAQDANTVEMSSTTLFTAKVHHKYDGNELEGPITAGLSGQEKLSPMVKTKAPVKYNYTAPGEELKLATINLETRSRRGVAKKAVEFSTGTPGWKVDQEIPVEGGTMKVKGLSCTGITGPWEITYEAYQEADGFTITGKLVGLLQADGSTSTLDHTVHIIYSGVDAGAVASGGVSATLRGAGSQYTIVLGGGNLAGIVWAPDRSKSANSSTNSSGDLTVTPADAGQCP